MDPRDGPDDRPACGEPGCDAPASFWWFDRGSDRWRPRCERHLLEVHPSVEVRAWLEAGYAKPVELGRPDDAPTDPVGGRAAGFREAVDEAMGWSGWRVPDDRE